ncbi:MAG: LptF/LptG family permease [Victivallales bacterium]|nr:LptF/LptG family permease [Victivallales bacterium]MCF7888583.1 LptF/LptG family permease [Victivallales bacterium]
MRILNLYVIKGILTILISSIMLLTFCMLGGNLLQALNYLAQGVPITDFIKFLIFITPMMMTYTIPTGILVAVLLLFGRMSSNNEITAMRACGISIFQIITPVILITFAMTVLCIYFQGTVAPTYYYRAKALLKNLATTHPDALIIPGTPCNFNDMVVYVKEKKDNKLEDVQVFVFSDNNQKVKQDITASSGKLIVNSKKETMKIILYNYNIIDYKDNNRISGDELTVNIDVGKAIENQSVTRDVGFLTFYDLLGRISLYHKLGLDTTEAEVNLNLRLAMGLAPIAFLLVGLPLAIRTSRSETSVGLFLSIILAGIYFFFIIGCRDNPLPYLRPQLLLWIPNIVFQVGGLIAIYKIMRK